MPAVSHVDPTSGQRILSAFHPNHAVASRSLYKVFPLHAPRSDYRSASFFSRNRRENSQRRNLPFGFRLSQNGGSRRVSQPNIVESLRTRCIFVVLKRTVIVFFARYRWGLCSGLWKFVCHHLAVAFRLPLAPPPVKYTNSRAISW